MTHTHHSFKGEQKDCPHCDCPYACLCHGNSTGSNMSCECHQFLAPQFMKVKKGDIESLNYDIKVKAEPPAPQPSWEKRFDELFPYRIPEHVDESYHPLLIPNMDLRRVLKTFISEEIQKAREIETLKQQLNGK